MMTKLMLTTAVGLCLAGCAVRPTEIDREPALAAVGAGLSPNVVPHEPYGNRPPPPAFNSLYTDGGSLYRDPRAMRRGDVLTVNISINDKATLGNNTGRSTDDEVANSGNANVGSLAVAGTFDTISKSSANGQGTIDRSEKIQLNVAAVVTEVLPDGNLVVSGSQEVRVNYEVRQLYVAGIVRPRDISKDNTISYEKIAEARISYGGRGRLSEAQQPGWGHQLYDIIKPF